MSTSRDICLLSVLVNLIHGNISLNIPTIISSSTLKVLKTTELKNLCKFCFRHRITRRKLKISNSTYLVSFHSVVSFYQIFHLHSHSVNNINKQKQIINRIIVLYLFYFLVLIALFTIWSILSLFFILINNCSLKIFSEQMCSVQFLCRI